MALQAEPNLTNTQLEQMYIVTHLEALMDLIASSLNGYLSTDHLVRSLRGLASSTGEISRAVPTTIEDCGRIKRNYIVTLVETYVIIKKNITALVKRPVHSKLFQQPSYKACLNAVYEFEHGAIARAVLPPKDKDGIFMMDQLNTDLASPEDRVKFQKETMKILQLRFQSIFGPGTGWGSMSEQCADVLCAPPDSGDFADFLAKISKSKETGKPVWMLALEELDLEIKEKCEGRGKGKARD